MSIYKNAFLALSVLFAVSAQAQVNSDSSSTSSRQVTTSLQVRATPTGALNAHDQLIGSGVWDYGSCLNNDSGMPPFPGGNSPYVEASDGRAVTIGGLRFFQKVMHYSNSKCESGKGYTVVRSSPGRACAVATYNHFCSGAPKNYVLKVGVWDFGNCAGEDRDLCPGLGLTDKNGASVVYNEPACASGKAKCTVDSLGFGKQQCEIARYIHTCQ